MKLPFSDVDVEYARSIGIPFDIRKDLSDDEIDTLTETVSDLLLYKGFDEVYNPTEDGLRCEDILDVIGRY